MSAQESLFDDPHPRPVIDVPLRGHARNTDPAGSRDAAATADLNGGCRRVLSALSMRYGFVTVAALQSSLPGMERNVIARRLKDLEDLGLAYADRDASPTAWRVSDEGFTEARRPEVAR